MKTAAPEPVEDIAELLDGIGEDLKVVFSGGALSSDENLLGLAKAVANSSAAGLCAGRNVFQRKDPGEILGHVRGLLDG